MSERGHSAIATPAGSRRYALLLVLLLAAFLVRTHRLGADSLWFDEASTARNLAIPLDQILQEAQSLGHGPYYLLLRLFPDLERTEFSLRYPSALFGGLGVAGMYAVGRRLLGEPGGVLSALLLLFAPMHVWYSREARTYSWTTAAALLTVAAMADLWRNKSRATWVRLILFQAVTIYAHLFAALANLWQTGFVMVQWVRGRNRPLLVRWVVAQIGVLLLASPILVAALWSTGQKSQISWVHPPTLFTLVDLSMRLSGVKFLGEYGWWMIGWIAWLVLLLWGILKIGPSLLSPIQSRLFLLAWAFVPLGTLFAASWLWKPLYVHRYLLFTLPAYLLLIAAGVLRSTKNGLVLLTAGVLVGSQMLGTWNVVQSPAYSRPDWRAAHQHLSSATEESDAVLFHPWLLKRPFDYYNQAGLIPESQLLTVGVPQGAETVSEETLDADMRAAVEQASNGSGRLWVVEKVIDERASGWLSAAGGWQLASEVPFADGLHVRLFVAEGNGDER